MSKVLQYGTFVFLSAAIMLLLSFVVEKGVEQIDTMLVPCQHGTEYVQGKCRCEGTPFNGSYCSQCQCLHGACSSDPTTPYRTSDYGCRCPTQSKRFGFLCDMCNTIDSECKGACKPDFYGKKCERICYANLDYTNNNDVCNTMRAVGGKCNTCHGHGTCQNGYCDCDDNWFDDGQLECIQTCPGSPVCSGHGVCQLFGNTAGCLCEEGWNGKDCNIPCPGMDTGKPCNNKGACNVDFDAGTATCDCDEKFRGPDCSIECPGDVVACNGHGTCDDAGTCTCQTNVQWSLPSCKCADELTCNAKGTCVDEKCVCFGNNSGEHCVQCKKNWHGDNCDLYCDPYLKANISNKVAGQFGCFGHGTCFPSAGSVKCTCNLDTTTRINVNGAVNDYTSYYERSMNCGECLEEYFPKQKTVNDHGMPAEYQVPCEGSCLPASCNNHGQCNHNYGAPNEKLCKCDLPHLDDDSFCTKCETNWYPLDLSTISCNRYCIASGSLPTECDGTIDCLSCNGHGSCTDEGTCKCDDSYTGDQCQIQCTSANGLQCGGHGLCESNEIQQLMEHEFRKDGITLFGCTCDPQDPVDADSRIDWDEKLAAGLVNGTLSPPPNPEFFGETCDYQCVKPPWEDSEECNGMGNCSIVYIRTPSDATISCTNDAACQTTQIQQIVSGDASWTASKGPFCHKEGDIVGCDKSSDDCYEILLKQRPKKMRSEECATTACLAAIDAEDWHQYCASVESKRQPAAFSSCNSVASFCPAKTIPSDCKNMVALTDGIDVSNKLNTAYEYDKRQYPFLISENYRAGEKLLHDEAEAAFAGLNQVVDVKLDPTFCPDYQNRYPTILKMRENKQYLCNGEITNNTNCSGVLSESQNNFYNPFKVKCYNSEENFKSYAEALQNRMTGCTIEENEKDKVYITAGPEHIDAVCEHIVSKFPSCKYPQPCDFNPCTDTCVNDGTKAICSTTGTLNSTCLKGTSERLSFTSYSCDITIPDATCPITNTFKTNVAKHCNDNNPILSRASTIQDNETIVITMGTYAHFLVKASDAVSTATRLLFGDSIAIYIRQGQIQLNEVESLQSCPVTDQQCNDVWAYVPETWYHIELKVHANTVTMTRKDTGASITKDLLSNAAITSISTVPGSSIATFKEIVMENDIPSPYSCTYETCNLDVSYREICSDIRRNVEYPSLLEPTGDVLVACSTLFEKTRLPDANATNANASFATVQSMYDLDWGKYCAFYNALSSTILVNYTDLESYPSCREFVDPLDGDKTCIDNALDYDWTTACQELDDAMIPSSLKSACTNTCYNHLLSTSDYCSDRNIIFSANKVVTETCATDWYNHCLQDSKGLLTGKCAAVECTCEIDKYEGVSGQSCELHCPLGFDGTACAEGLGMGKCVYTASQKTFLASGKKFDPIWAIEGECQCFLSEGTRNCDIKCNGCNNATYTDGQIGICDNARGVCDCLPPFTSINSFTTEDWRGKNITVVERQYNIPYSQVMTGQVTDVTVAECQAFAGSSWYGSVSGSYPPGCVYHIPAGGAHNMYIYNTATSATACSAMYPCVQKNTTSQDTFRIRMMQGSESFVKNALQKIGFTLDETGTPSLTIEECQEAANMLVGGNFLGPADWGWTGCRFQGGQVYWSTGANNACSPIWKCVIKIIVPAYDGTIDWETIFYDFVDRPENYWCIDKACDHGNSALAGNLDKTSSRFNFDCNSECPGTNNLTLIPCSARGRCGVTGQCICDAAKVQVGQNENGFREVFQVIPGIEVTNTKLLVSSLDRTGYRGDACEKTCRGFEEENQDMSSICSGHGKCDWKAECVCDLGYIGTDCEFKCPGFTDGDKTICNGHGTCQMASLARINEEIYGDGVEAVFYGVPDMSLSSLECQSYATKIGASFSANSESTRPKGCWHYKTSTFNSLNYNSHPTSSTKCGFVLTDAQACIQKKLFGQCEHTATKLQCISYAEINDLDFEYSYSDFPSSGDFGKTKCVGSVGAPGTYTFNDGSVVTTSVQEYELLTVGAPDTVYALTATECGAYAIDNSFNWIGSNNWGPTWMSGCFTRTVNGNIRVLYNTVGDGTCSISDHSGYTNIACIQKKRSTFPPVCASSFTSPLVEISTGDPDLSVSEAECQAVDGSNDYLNSNPNYPSGCITHGGLVKWNPTTTSVQCGAGAWETCLQKPTPHFGEIETDGICAKVDGKIKWTAPGHTFILSDIGIEGTATEAECAEYAQGTTYSVGTFSGLPRGCSHYNAGTDIVYWNINSPLWHCSANYKCVLKVEYGPLCLTEAAASSDEDIQGSFSKGLKDAACAGGYTDTATNTCQSVRPMIDVSFYVDRSTHYEQKITVSCIVISDTEFECVVCECFSDVVVGFWGNLVCSSCEKAYGNKQCAKECPGGQTNMCSSNGQCLFGSDIHTNIFQKAVCQCGTTPMSSPEGGGICEIPNTGGNNEFNSATDSTMNGDGSEQDYEYRSFIKGLTFDTKAEADAKCCELDDLNKVSTNEYCMGVYQQVNHIRIKTAGMPDGSISTSEECKAYADGTSATFESVVYDPCYFTYCFRYVIGILKNIPSGCYLKDDGVVGWNPITSGVCASDFACVERTGGRFDGLPIDTQDTVDYTYSTGPNDDSVSFDRCQERATVLFPPPQGLYDLQSSASRPKGCSAKKFLEFTSGYGDLSVSLAECQSIEQGVIGGYWAGTPTSATYPQGCSTSGGNYWYNTVQHNTPCGGPSGKNCIKKVVADFHWGTGIVQCDFMYNCVKFGGKFILAMGVTNVKSPISKIWFKSHTPKSALQFNIKTTEKYQGILDSTTKVCNSIEDILDRGVDTCYHYSEEMNDCSLCSSGFTGKDCSVGCQKCLMGGECSEKPSDDTQPMCNCPSGLEGVWGRNCCPTGFRVSNVLTWSQKAQSEVDEIKIPAAFDPVTTNEVDASFWCKPCPGISVSDWLDTKAFYKICSGRGECIANTQRGENLCECREPYKGIECSCLSNSTLSYTDKATLYGCIGSSMCPENELKQYVSAVDWYFHTDYTLDETGNDDDMSFAECERYAHSKNLGTPPQNNWGPLGCRHNSNGGVYYSTGTDPVCSSSWKCVRVESSRAQMALYTDQLFAAIDAGGYITVTFGDPMLTLSQEECTAYYASIFKSMTIVADTTKPKGCIANAGWSGFWYNTVGGVVCGHAGYQCIEKPLASWALTYGTMNMFGGQTDPFYNTISARSWGPYGNVAELLYEDRTITGKSHLIQSGAISIKTRDYTIVNNGAGLGYTYQLVGDGYSCTTNDPSNPTDNILTLNIVQFDASEYADISELSDKCYRACLANVDCGHYENKAFFIDTTTGWCKFWQLQVGGNVRDACYAYRNPMANIKSYEKRDVEISTTMGALVGPKSHFRCVPQVPCHLGVGPCLYNSDCAGDLVCKSGPHEGFKTTHMVETFKYCASTEPYVAPCVNKPIDITPFKYAEWVTVETGLSDMSVSEAVCGTYPVTYQPMPSPSFSVIDDSTKPIGCYLYAYVNTQGLQDHSYYNSAETGVACSSTYRCVQLPSTGYTMNDKLALSDIIPYKGGRMAFINGVFKREHAAGHYVPNVLDGENKIIIQTREYPCPKGTFEVPGWADAGDGYTIQDSGLPIYKLTLEECMQYGTWSGENYNNGWPAACSVLTSDGLTRFNTHTTSAGGCTAAIQCIVGKKAPLEIPTARMYQPSKCVLCPSGYYSDVAGLQMKNEIQNTYEYEVKIENGLGLTCKGVTVAADTDHCKRQCDADETCAAVSISASGCTFCGDMSARIIDIFWGPDFILGSGYVTRTATSAQTCVTACINDGYKYSSYVPNCRCAETVESTAHTYTGGTGIYTLTGWQPGTPIDVGLAKTSILVPKDDGVYDPTVTEAECSNYNVATRSSYNSNQWSGVPKGCYDSGGNVRFNSHPTTTGVCATNNKCIVKQGYRRIENGRRTWKSPCALCPDQKTSHPGATSAKECQTPSTGKFKRTMDITGIFNDWKSLDAQGLETCLPGSEMTVVGCVCCTGTYIEVNGVCTDCMAGTQYSGWTQSIQTCGTVCTWVCTFIADCVVGTTSTNPRL